MQSATTSLNLKRAPAVPFENRVTMEATQRYYLHTNGREKLTNWETSNVSYYMKQMLMFYVKYPLLMYDNASY